MNKDSYTPCTKCGRPMRYCKGECCGKKPEGCDCREYGCKHNACIREKNPDCPYEAVIPSVTVETINNLKDLADCFVHVEDINTTFYIDDKHRIMVTWAGLVSADDYDFDANPLNVRSQIIYDAKNNKAAIYDNKGAHYIFQISDIENDYMLLENKPAINGVTLEGDKSLKELDIPAIEEVALTFDTVADMQASDKLVFGGYARTLGFHSVNDGGGALYIITNTGTANGMDVISVGELYANFIVTDEIRPEQVGAYGDGAHNDVNNINLALSYDLPVKADRDYLISGSVVLTGGKTLKGNGTFIYNGPRTQAVFRLTGGYNELEVKDIIDVKSYAASGYDGGWHGWNSANYAGILVESNYNNVKFERVINTTTGLLLHANNAGFFKNKIEGVNIYNCKYGIYCLTSGANGWFNSNEIRRIMISVGAQGTDIATNSASITTYGVYQEVNNNTYGMKYNLFDQLFYEIGYKDTFIGCYLTFAGGNIFRNLTSEITNSASFATVNMVYSVAVPSTKFQQSYGNVFEDCVNMGGNFAITYQNMKPSILSYQDVAKFDTDKPVSILSDHDFTNKSINIDNNNHSSIRGYNVVKVADTTSTLSSCILARTDYAKVRTDGDNQIIINPAGSLALNIPVSAGDTFQVYLRGVAASSSDNKNIMIKTYNAAGNFVLASSDAEKPLSGYLTKDGSNRGYVLKSGYASGLLEFTVNDSSIKNIVILIYGTISGIDINSYNANASVLKHWGNFQFLNYLPDVFYSATKPNSSANTTNTFDGSVVYKAVAANIGEKWTLTGGSWV